MPSKRRGRGKRRAVLAGLCGAILLGLAAPGQAPAREARLLTDPFLQLPTADSVRVVWFTEFAGSEHFVRWGPALEQRAAATSFRLSRMYEDEKSDPAPGRQRPERTTPRAVWRHEAVLSGLRPGTRVPYAVTSRGIGGEAASAVFTAAALPPAGQPLRILLTSDHQRGPMTPANLQKVVESLGHVDAVFLAGDLVSIADRASQWFDDGRGGAFFPALQGRAHRLLPHDAAGDGTAAPGAVAYRGGAILQRAPLFPAIGNHEVMGRFDPTHPLGTQFRRARPSEVARADYARRKAEINPSGDPDIAARWLRDNSFNTTSYEEIFTLPDDGPEGERYYAVRFGDVFLISLFATRIWRPREPGPEPGAYQETESALERPDEWGYGLFPFDALSEGSTQLDWLKGVLSSKAFRSAPYRVVILHHPIHGLGDHAVPAFSPPRQAIERSPDGEVVSVRYSYPADSNVLVTVVKPLLERAGVDLVLNGHSHIWNRFRSPSGTHYLESSNVGYGFGCNVEGAGRRLPSPGGALYPEADYPPTGDPAGLPPVMPSEFAPQQGDDGRDLPCVSSDEITVFSILDTGSGSVRSYLFDTRQPGGPVRLFDAFPIGRGAGSGPGG